MQRFDAFAKPLEEFKVRTQAGGYISILTMVTIGYLLFSELLFFLDTEQKDEMAVDLKQDTKPLKMQLDIWVFKSFDFSRWFEFCETFLVSLCGADDIATRKH